MSKNKKWKRKAKRIMGEAHKGCNCCKFLIERWYVDGEDMCELEFDDDECNNLRELRQISKGSVFRNIWGGKIV